MTTDSPNNVSEEDDDDDEEEEEEVTLHQHFSAGVSPKTCFFRVNKVGFKKRGRKKKMHG